MPVGSNSLNTIDQLSYQAVPFSSRVCCTKHRCTYHGSIAPPAVAHTHWSLAPGRLNVPSRMGSVGPASFTDRSAQHRGCSDPPYTPPAPPPLASRASSLTPNLRRGGGAHRLSASGKVFHARPRSAQPTGHAALSAAMFFWETGGFSPPHVCNGACLLAQTHLIRLISSRIMCLLHAFARTVRPMCVP